MTLLESVNKRCTFLEHAVGLSGLTNVQVIRDRAEVCSFLFYILKLCLSNFSLFEFFWNFSAAL